MITDDRCALWTTETGVGDPVLLCHGGPGLWDMFGDLAGDLASRFRLIRWDQRGGGRSERRGPYTLQRMVADVDAVRDHYGLDRVAVLGHSWGAHLGLLYALAHPDRVSKLVYVSGVGLGHEWHAEFKRNFEQALGKRHVQWAGVRARSVNSRSCNGLRTSSTERRPSATPRRWPRRGFRSTTT